MSATTTARAKSSALGVGLGWGALVVFIAVALDYPVLPVLVQVGGISIYPEDALTAAMAAALVFTRGPRLAAGMRGVTGRWLLIAAFLLISLQRGVLDFGPGIAVNEARATIQLLVVAAWVISQMQDPEFPRRLDRFVTAVGITLTVIAVFHIATRGLGGADTQIQQGDLLVTSRPLVSAQALILGLVGIYGIVLRRRLALSSVFLAVALLAQHRSVWAALLAAFVVILLAGRPDVRARLIPVAAFVGLLGFVLVGFGLLGDLPHKIGYALTSSGTFEDRTDAWSTLVAAQNQQGWFSILLGQPFGTGYARLNENGLLVTYTPHNWYVVLYLRLGLIAVAVVVWTLLSALLRNLRARRTVEAAWLVALAVYAIPYHLSWYLAPFLAVALAANHRGLSAPDEVGAVITPCATPDDQHEGSPRVRSRSW